MGSPVKTLTIGSPSGRIKEVIAKVGAIKAKHGDFHAVLVLGDFWAPHDGEGELSAEEKSLLDGELELPLPTYFVTGTTAPHPLVRAKLEASPPTYDPTTHLATPSEVLPKLFFLGKYGVAELGGEGGLRVAFLGGEWDPAEWAKSVQAGASEYVPQTVEDLFNPCVTSPCISALTSHPSFKTPPQVSAPAAATAKSEPMSLAAARAQAAAERKALEAAKEAKKATATQSARPPIDILLTNPWPSGVTLFSDPSKLPHPTSRMWGAPAVATLTRLCQPRYHFALAPGPKRSDSSPSFVGLEDELRDIGVFWEREPFRNAGDGVHSACQTTRFLSIARFANAKKARWFMALNMVPAASMDKDQLRAIVPPANATASPFATGYGSAPVKRPVEEQPADSDSGLDSGANFRWAGAPTRGKRPRRDRDGATGANNIPIPGSASGTYPGPSSDGGGGGNLPSGSGLPARPDVELPPSISSRPPTIPVGPEDCWFCLSNPQCAKHLIAAIGTECYVALPKGQLPPTEQSPVPGGGHVLIVPITHIPSLHPPSSSTTSILAELDAWREAVRACYASFGCAAAMWEVCKTSNTRAGHMQVQAVPVPLGVADGLEAAFERAAEEAGYEFKKGEEALRLLKGGEESSGDYVRLDLGERTWFLDLDGGRRRFNLQFARQTLAGFLGVPQRADWKVCARGDKIEEAETSMFREAFQEYASKVGDDDDE